MIERIIDWSAKNRFIVILLYIFIAGFGIYAVINLPVDAIHDLSENQVIVFTGNSSAGGDLIIEHG